MNKAQKARLIWYFEHPGRYRKETDSADFYLLKRGLIRRQKGLIRSRLTLTKKGYSLLLEIGSRPVTRFKHHNDLAHRYAEYLKTRHRIVWLNTQFRVYHQGRYYKVRPDVFSLVCTLNSKRIHPLIHEIKHKRSDFLSSLKKRSLLLIPKIAERVYFVTPPGVARKHEVPAPYGLIHEISPNRFKVIRIAKRNTVKKYSTRFWMNLVLKRGDTVQNQEIPYRIRRESTLPGINVNR